MSRRSKVRMEAFLAGCALAAPLDADPSHKLSSQQQHHHHPNDLVLLQEGLAGLAIPPPEIRTTSSSSSSSPPHSKSNGAATRQLSTSSTRSTIASQKRPQINQEELLLRLEIYIRTLQRVRKLNEECVIAMEPPKTIRARACLITDAFVATAGTIRNLRHVLSRLLNCITMEVLAVEVLCEDIIKAIRRIVLEYEHGTSFASLAFLSTPEVNADSLLSPLIVKYLKYLQSNWEQLITACELERMLTRALDPEMRKLFKTIEFRSIGHLLEVCYEQRQKLQHIELAPNVCAVTENINNLIHSKEAVRQALRDLQREVITVNGHVLPPVTSRKELLNLLSQTLNSRTLTPAERPKHNKARSPKLRRHESSPATLENKGPKKGNGSKAKENVENMPDTPKSAATEESDYIFSSEADSGMSDAVDDSSLSEGSPTPQPSTRKVRRRNFHLSTIDLLTRRLLIAASRTGNGGDAYFVVRDLFGGEDVEVVATNTYPSQGRLIRPGTIDILVRLASVTIKCHQSFDIYPKSMVGECEPLIQFHTTTTETISLQEVRSTDDDNMKGDMSSKTPDHAATTGGGALLVLQEQESSRTGWRTISIRPAIYEKVEVWGTPS